ncbi:carbonic anhydrase-like isoform X2 [Atheta coriaria]|uniref:carbonic anhydrase-like isoform X2 n=1 Tax=Dalotia coriaria TaxID=877792 RepID=UPI0031F4681B
MIYLFLYLCVLLSTFPKSAQGKSGAICNSTGAKDILTEDRPINDKYDVRPNLFIDRDNLLGKTSHDHKKEFSYGNGPYGCAHWPKLFPKCGGKHQSPINIDIANLKTITLPNLKWNNLYEEIPEKMSVSNTHNTFLEMVYNGNHRPRISGGPLTKPYSLKSLHFHWSSSDHKGSEHTISKKSFPMEMHVVHYRSDLNFSNAAVLDKGLCVIAYIFEISNDKCNDALTSILSVAEENTMEKDIEVDLTNLFRLDSLVDTIDSEYVTYSGSLTTPPCHESVIWIISPYTITIAKKQIERFRQISMASGGFGDNHRPIQPLNDRVVNFVKSNKQ